MIVLSSHSFVSRETQRYFPEKTYFQSIYEDIPNKEEAIEGQWAQVENVYQRRADLIPNLVNTVKGYADFEKETYTPLNSIK